MLQKGAVWYSVLQCGSKLATKRLFVAVSCSALFCAAECCSVLQCVAVWCSVVQSGAVWCNVLQCVAICCSVLQSVAICCSVLQCVAVCIMCSIVRYREIDSLCTALTLYTTEGTWKRMQI